jgi:hypothetical protein
MKQTLGPMEHYFLFELGYKDSNATLKAGKFRVKFDLSDSRFVGTLLTPLFVEVLREAAKSEEVNKDSLINALLNKKVFLVKIKRDYAGKLEKIIMFGLMDPGAQEALCRLKLRLEIMPAK